MGFFSKLFKGPEIDMQKSSANAVTSPVTRRITRLASLSQSVCSICQSAYTRSRYPFAT